MAELTPMMQQYMETKKQYPDCILFYRLGDFYEMFFEDALTASRELEITLTGKNCGQEERAPMCGVPYHAVEGYLSRLVSKGYKVAICEQMEDPKLAKGLVKREVVRIVTPGTNLNIQALEENKNNYIMCIAYFAGKTGISVADVTTGDYYMTEVEDNRKLLDEVMKYAPSEIICNDAFLVSGMELDDLKERLGIAIYSLEPHYFDDDLCRKCLMKHFGVNSLSGLGVEEFPNGVIAAGSLLSYLYDTQKIPLSHFTHIEPYLVNRYMLLDSSTRRNLELKELPGTANEKIEQEMDGLEDLYLLICDSIEEEPPITIREGGMIKAGYNEDIDNLRRAKTEGKNWLAELENAERERTGIKNLRVKYNKVFGYYLEVTKSYLNMVPEDYIRKQTLTNAERYTMPRLKELEDTILNAEDKLCTLEYDLFCEIRDRIAGEIERIQTTAKAVARLDVFCSFSLVAEQNHYVRPVLNEKGQINIKDGRHPVVEKMIEHDMFIPNDTYLDNNSHQIAVITGPNMAGKSTYMRQTALIVLMAQVGSFVPARQAAIGIVDRIFTRVGASDDLASGQSTFMVEMSEVANILRNATRNLNL